MGCKDTFRVVGSDGQENEIDGNRVAPNPTAVDVVNIWPTPDPESSPEEINAAFYAQVTPVLDTVDQLEDSDFQRFGDFYANVVKKNAAIIRDEISRHTVDLDRDLNPGAEPFYRRSFNPGRLSGAAASVARILAENGKSTAKVRDIQEAAGFIGATIGAETGGSFTVEGSSGVLYARNATVVQGGDYIRIGFHKPAADDNQVNAYSGPGQLVLYISRSIAKALVDYYVNEVI